MKKKVLVTGAAGFIGYHLCKRLLQEEDVELVGLDNLNSYYDVELKRARLKDLGAAFNFKKVDLVDFVELKILFEEFRFDRVVHLAAQAGVRYSIENPRVYVDSNVVGSFNLFECARAFPVEHFLYASSSSVYGDQPDAVLSTDLRTDSPVSLYAATKKSCENFAFSYSSLYKIPLTGLRFFTVYGPYGRPDMAYYKFTEAMKSGQTIPVYNHGKMSRDFTYVDDIIEGINRLLPRPSQEECPHQIFNIGRGRPEALMDMISLLEKYLGLKAQINFLPHQKGDVFKTHAEIQKLKDYCGYEPKVSLEEGLAKFVEWYLSAGL